ncbi:MAG: hypoxanthine phosphoribosyltransferase [Gammaproteobacteria bacterium]|jgi:hypoxanthine phosphoribosyltransferase
MKLERALEVHQQSSLKFDANQVDIAIAELAQKIEADYKNEFPLVLCVMNGGLYLTGQLLRHWEFPLTVDYVHATRYRLATLGKDVLWKAYPQNALKGRNVIIVDDIFDQGYTLEEVKTYCLKQGAEKCVSVFLVRKTHQKKMANIAPDFVGLESDDCHLYGVGMDLNGHFRNLSSIHSIPEKVKH